MPTTGGAGFELLTSRRLDQLLLSSNTTATTTKAAKCALPCLQQLILVKCPSLDQPLQVTSSSLRLLNISHCDFMPSVHLTCPRLATLLHDGCSSLHTLLLYHATALEEVNASTLPALARVEITSPNAIRCLDLSNCKRLQSCSIQCPHLRHVNLTLSRTVALRFCKEVRFAWMQNWRRGSRLKLAHLHDDVKDNDSLVSDADEENDDDKTVNAMSNIARVMSTATSPPPPPPPLSIEQS
jgi:hypothetical protein